MHDEVVVEAGIDCIVIASAKGASEYPFENGQPFDVTMRATTKDTTEMMKNPPRPGKLAVGVLAEPAQVGGGVGLDEAAKVPRADLHSSQAARRFLRKWSCAPSRTIAI
jgi:hypothetical protein